MSEDMKEFVGKSQAEAVEKAARHFGVPEGQLDVRVIELPVSGLGSRVLILAAEGNAPLEVGPVGEFVAGVIERMGLGGRSRIRETEEDGEIVVHLSGEEVGRIARRDRALPDALSHLADRAAAKLIDKDRRARVEIVRDAQPGDERLERLAASAAEEVLRSGQPKLLDEMNSRERWTIHNALKQHDGVRSESVGEGRLKRVKILPE